jgi:pyruvate-formate lyase-activating enzyme
MDSNYFGAATLIDKVAAGYVAKQFSLSLDTPVLMLPFGKGIGWETRRLYFGLAVAADGRLNHSPILRANSEVVTTRIFSFGNCNVACPYCKRDCQFIGADGIPIVAQPTPFYTLLEMAEAAHARKEVIRFSGGDPMMFPAITLAISTYMSITHGVKCSIAHNGSGVQWVQKIAPLLASAAIDLKGVPDKMGAIMGIAPETGRRFFDKSLESQRILLDAGVLVDCRTPVFGDTSIEEMLFLADKIDQRAFWTWRIYKQVEGCNWTSPDTQSVIDAIQTVSKRHPDQWIGLRAKWNKGGMIYARGGYVLN